MKLFNKRNKNSFDYKRLSSSINTDTPLTTAEHEASYAILYAMCKEWLVNEIKLIPNTISKIEDSVIFRIHTFELMSLETNEGGKIFAKLMHPTPGQWVAARLIGLHCSVQYRVDPRYLAHCSKVFWDNMSIFTNIDISYYSQTYPHLWLIRFIQQIPFTQSVSPQS